MPQYPKYYETWQGKVIRSLVLHGNEPISFNKLMEETGLPPKGLLRALAPLRQNNVVKYEGKNYLLGDDTIRQEWLHFLGENATAESEKGIKKEPSLKKAIYSSDSVNLVQWLMQWREIRNLSFPVESKHFFLEGEYLDELARVLIDRAKHEILVTNPFIDSCHLTKTLENALLREIAVTAVARRPKDNPEDTTKRECQASLRKAGMRIHYDNQIHAKIILIDDEIAIVSSMNLYSASSGGFTKEAGIVSIDKTVIASVSKYIKDILSKPESTESRY